MANMTPVAMPGLPLVGSRHSHSLNAVVSSIKSSESYNRDAA